MSDPCEEGPVGAATAVSRRTRGKRVVRARQIVQGLSLALFFVLLFATRTGEDGNPTGLIKLFFDLDPLILVSTWLATHSLEGLSLLALVTVALTLLLGRVFCGWICPFGVLHQIVTWLRARRRKGQPSAELYSLWQRGKYYMLVALLLMAVFGVHWIGMIDPMAMLYRSTITTVVPATQTVVEETATAIYDHDPGIGPLRLTGISEPVYQFLRDRVFYYERQLFSGSTLLFLLFAAALLLNLVRPRFWCRYVCPLGALLGLLSRRGIMRLDNQPSECKDCGLCAKACPAAAQPEQPGQWLRDECFGCWNCVSSCSLEALDFRFEAPWRRPEAATVSLTRRATLRSLAGGAGALLLFRVAPESSDRTYNPVLVRPPGARAEREFLQRCIQCGQCMKVCPTNALHPTLMEAGLEGIWTPFLLARIGYCEYECNLCGQVCPTGAIEPLELAVKKEVRIGLATFDTSRCLPYAYERECIVCEEHCPIPTKAIFFEEREIKKRDGSTRILKLPRVDAGLCTGCGICETKCPFQDRAAIRITSAGETRHPGNQPIL